MSYASECPDAPVFSASLRTPPGMLYIRESGGSIIYIGFEKDDGPETVTPLIKRTEDQLNEYFAGKRKEFGIPLRSCGSDLQKSVWDALTKIPYGETRTYKQIASDAGRPEAIRAVASMIGKNPISVIVPCHRVIGSDGKMRGYAGGIPFKEYLLRLENGNSG